MARALTGRERPARPLVRHRESQLRGPVGGDISVEHLDDDRHLVGVWDGILAREGDAAAAVVIRPYPAQALAAGELGDPGTTQGGQQRPAVQTS